MIIMRRLFLICLLALIPAASLYAQDDVTQYSRDALDLARRYLAYAAPYAIPQPPPSYAPGDTAVFWVGKRDSDLPVRITAELAARTPSMYFWVEQGLEYDSQSMNTFAAQVDTLLSALRDNFGQGTVIEGIGRVSASEYLLPLPDVDNDPHLYILFTTNLREDQETVINPNDSLPALMVPGGYSNERELITINTSLYPSAPIPDGVYANVLLRALYRLLSDYHTPDQAVWLEQALGWLLANELQISGDPAAAVSTYLNAPETPLLRPQTLTSGQQTRGAQMLFMEYLTQRFGTSVVAILFDQNGEALAAVKRALQESGLTDYLTGGSITAEEVFADFIMANGLNAPVGDGRFVYATSEESASLVEEGLTAVTETISRTTATVLDEQTVTQFGTRYFLIPPGSGSSALQLAFEGIPSTARLPFAVARNPEDFFYWSGNQANRNTTLTRRFDLTGVSDAMLEFDTWYSLAPHWNYAYLSVSTDNGQSWTPLNTSLSTRENGHGLSYGSAYTGISSTERPRPFPAMGIVIDSTDGMTITEVVSSGAANRAGVRAGDMIIGYDGELWPGQPNILALLGNYAPEDTLNLLIQRDGERIEIPVVLAAHPTRIVLPEPAWLSQQANLTAYSGQQILVRFEYVSMPNTENEGFALDNIRISALGYEDLADIDGEWETLGFQRINNVVEQPFLVQVASTGNSDTPPRIQRLLTSASSNVIGEWNFALQSQESLLIAVSGLSEVSTQPAQFSLTVSPLAGS